MKIGTSVSNCASPAASSYGWSGCYGGVLAGGGAQNDSFTALVEGGGSGGGDLVGGQLGCNIQNGQIVFGIEGEAVWSGLSETTQTSITGSPQKISGRNRWNADLAARAGLAGRLLNFNQLFDGVTIFTFNKTESASADLVKLGVNYHFNAGNLVPAKY